MACSIADLPAEFAGVDPDTAQLWLDAATAAIDSARWVCAGVDPCKGALMLASHYLKSEGLGTGGAAVGTVTAKSIGGVSVSLAVSASASGPHGSTSYGRAYDLLAARVDKARRRHLPPAPQPA